MAAHKLFVTQSATVAGVTLKGFIQVSVSVDGREVIPRGDGKFSAELSGIVFLDEIVEVVAEDCSVAPAVGATGSLNISNAQILNGLQRGGNYTISANSCVVLSSAIEHTIDGASRLRVRVRALSADGVSPALTFSST